MSVAWYLVNHGNDYLVPYPLKQQFSFKIIKLRDSVTHYWRKPIKIQQGVNFKILSEYI
jgi:hypothetical protein